MKVLKISSQNWTNSMVGFLVGFPVLLCNAAVWLFFSFRSKENVASDHYWAAVGTSTDVGRLTQYEKYMDLQWYAPSLCYNEDVGTSTGVGRLRQASAWN